MLRLSVPFARWVNHTGACINYATTISNLIRWHHAACVQLELMYKSSHIHKFIRSNYGQLFLILGFAFIAFYPVFSNDFTNYDDPQQLTENKDITALSLTNLRVIFSSFYVGMYQPFTTLCFAIVFKFFALKPFAYHALSLLLHFINISLVFLLIKKLTEKREIVFTVTLLFALNPMQVEAVAWVSATSTLLFSLFFLLASINYLNFLEDKRSKRYYYFSLLYFVFSLLSKSAAVTLPMLLLLFDYFKNTKITRKDILNKLPFFALSIAFGLITIVGRKDAGHIFDISKYYDIFDRIIIIFSSISFYITSIFIPFKLSAFHPYPQKSGIILPLAFYIMTLFLIAIIVFLIKVKRNNKEVRFGFLFFLLSISVMIELIPVGLQIVKERYMYVSCIGIYFAVFSYLFSIVKVKSIGKAALNFSIIALSVLFLSISFQRSGVWKNSFTLWNDVINKYPNVSSAYINRGNAYTLKNNYAKAISDYNKAIQLEPEAADAYMNRAVAESKLGNLEGALRDYDKAIAIGTVDDKMYAERAVLKIGLQDAEGALEDYGKAIELSPDNEKYYNQRGIVYGMTGKFVEAYDDFSKAIELDPDYADAYSNRGYSDLSLGNYNEAISDLSLAIQKNPNEARSYYLRGLAHELNNDLLSACVDMREAYSLGFADAAEEMEKVCK